MLPKIINSDQTGFLKRSFIGENIHLINEIIDYTKSENIEGLLLFLDFEKAFDTIEWNYIYKTLKLSIILVTNLFHGLNYYIRI
mgnify:CR=1 FL=1